MQPCIPYLKITFFFYFHAVLFITISAKTHPNNLQHPDYEALIAIKSRISSDPYSTLLSWSNNSSLHLCKWQGITCGRHNRVVVLSLPSRNLAGTLSPFVGNLTFLHELTLYGNLFKGEIPNQISHLHRIRELNLVSNSFQGEIPANLSRCVRLTALGLSHNNMVGRIPPSLLSSLPYLTVFDVTQNHFSGSLESMGFGNMTTSLQVLGFAHNLLQGRIPNDIGRLRNLVQLDLSNNLISPCTIPASIFNLSSLGLLSLNNIAIQGHLPQDLGIRLPNLYHLSLVNTSLSGKLPTSLSNLTQLTDLFIAYNAFTGRFFLDGTNLPYIQWLDMGGAFSMGDQARDLSFLETLTNCTRLQQLVIGGNNFIGDFPRSILNMSATLLVIDVVSNQLSGEIPSGLGKFVNLVDLFLDNNFFTGPIPSDISKLESIQRLDFDNNNFTGQLPNSLQNLTFLSAFTAINNNLQGPLPTSLGSCRYLQALGLFNNNLSGGLPVELLGASNLLWLLISGNNLEGSIPVEISRLQSLVWMDISDNSFSGEIPTTLGGCTSLTQLYMSRNLFTGSIPASLSPLQSIQELDLSHNNFSGQIPTFFSTWPYLSILNLSFNSLGGQVPMNGVFANTSAVSLLGNDKLCGGVSQLHLPSCPQISTHSKKRRLSSAVIAGLISVACVMLAVLSISVCLYFFWSSRKRKNESPALQSIKPFPDVSYQMLHTATEGFSVSNLLGVGGFGSVYKGILQQDDKQLVVAVKVINLGHEGANKSFVTECKALRNIRHRNLVKVITACSSIDAQRNDFKALVYEFMSKGSLEDWLHSPDLVTSTEHSNGSLSLLQRLGISIDVASALEYLHVECADAIVHCDLKPSNILIDDDMAARVGDFGLAKFVFGALSSNSSSTQIRGTIGYAAPEYGTGSKVSPEGDIYSLGIIILELMTSKKPTNLMFNNGLNLHDFAKSSLPNRVMEIIDHGMLGDDEVLRSRNANDIKKTECIKSIITIGVQCSMELPQERMKIKDVVNELNSTRKNLQARVFLDS